MQMFELLVKGCTQTGLVRNASRNNCNSFRIKKIDEKAHSFQQMDGWRMTSDEWWVRKGESSRLRKSWIDKVGNRTCGRDAVRGRGGGKHFRFVWKRQATSLACHVSWWFVLLIGKSRKPSFLICRQLSDAFLFVLKARRVRKNGRRWWCERW